jgi:hypothetical protein
VPRIDGGAERDRAQALALVPLEPGLTLSTTWSNDRADESNA